MSPMPFEQLNELAERASRRILESSDVRLVSHNDADGIASAGIMAHVLLRAGIPFITTIVPRLNEPALERIRSQSELTVLCDMGSGQPELVEQLGDTVVLDHHRPKGESSALDVNPHHVGIDGSFELCASGVCYLVARGAAQLGGWSHDDLVGLAVAGMVGDKQRMQGPNLEIVKEGVGNGSLVPVRGLKVPDYPIEELFMRCHEPYLVGITGDKEACHSFAATLGLDGKNVDELTEEEGRRLADAAVLEVLKGAHPSIGEMMVGEYYRAPAELVPNTIELAELMGACGKLDRAGIGLALCLRDESVLDEARDALATHERVVLKEIKRTENAIKEMKWLRWAAVDDLKTTGVVSSTLLQYSYPPDKPLVLLSLRSTEVRVSARATKAMVLSGLDLASALSEAAELAGGRGGGHAVAAGAEIPKGSENQFIEKVHSIVQQQLEVKQDETHSNRELQDVP
ncbi:MAG: DHH family phosphoesterase [Methermicoccaceae archaeon]